MQPRDLEPEMEEFLLRLVPDLATSWQGSPPDEIERVERLAGRSLPRFYRWFLMRMGRSLGPLQFRSLDFSAERVMSSYAQGLVIPDTRFFMIGYETDEVMPLHLFYDFEHVARDDARVIKMDSGGVQSYEQFDTFREMLAWGKFVTFWIDRLPQSCRGSLAGGTTPTLQQLDPVMESLGFRKPISTGSNCGVYERANAGMAVSATPRDGPSAYHFFRFGGSDAGMLRRMLGAIATETSLEVEIKEWTPPLLDPANCP